MHVWARLDEFRKRMRLVIGLTRVEQLSAQQGTVSGQLDDTRRTGGDVIPRTSIDHPSSFHPSIQLEPRVKPYTPPLIHPAIEMEISQVGWKVKRSKKKKKNIVLKKKKKRKEFDDKLWWMIIV